MSVTAGVSDTIIAIRDKLRGKIGQTKLKGIGPVEHLNGLMMMRLLMLPQAFPRMTRILLVRMMLGCGVWLRVG